MSGIPEDPLSGDAPFYVRKFIYSASLLILMTALITFFLSL